MIRSLKAALLLAGIAATLSPALAHRQWLLPSATIVSGPEPWVTVDAAISNDLFYVDHRPMNLATVKVWAPDGTPGEIRNGATGQYRSVFDVKLDRPGTWKIGTEMSGVMGSFKVNGEERRVGGRPAMGGAGGAGAPGAQPPAGAPRPQPVSVADIPADATDVKLTQSSSRNEIFVTAGEPTTTVFRPTGKGLEMEPITHPNELVAGETARFRFLADGKPAAGLKLAVVPGGKRYRDAENGFDVTTGADGIAAIKWPAAGMYWLNATLTDDKATEPRATGRRLAYTATVEVMTP